MGILTTGSRVRLAGTNLEGTVRSHVTHLDAVYVNWDTNGVGDEWPFEMEEIEVVPE